MHYICLDTNAWIHLANGTEPVKLLEFIEQEIEKDNITIILPEMVKTEWSKRSSINPSYGSLKHCNDILASLGALIKAFEKDKRGRSFLFGDDDAEKDISDEFKEIHAKLGTKKEQIEEEVANNIKRINKIFAASNTIDVPTTNKMLLDASKLALAKKKPVGSTNGIADAIVMLSYLDYVKRNSLDGSYFVSYNTDDFCETQQKKYKLHRDIKPKFDKYGCKFFTFLGKVIDEIRKDIITQEELEYIEWSQFQSEHERDIEYCHECDREVGVSEVSFSGTVNVFDHRIMPRVGPNQTSLFGYKAPSEKFPFKLYDIVESGSCDYCGTEHFKCARCKTVIAISDDKIDEIFECDGCGLKYKYDTSGDLDHMGEGDYHIYGEEQECIKCRELFDATETGLEICEKCEEEYIEN